MLYFFLECYEKYELEHFQVFLFRTMFFIPGVGSREEVHGFFHAPNFFFQKSLKIVENI